MAAIPLGGPTEPVEIEGDPFAEQLDKDTEKEFERWAIREGMLVDRFSSGTREGQYSNPDTRRAWIIWQESRFAYSYVATLHRRIKELERESGEKLGPFDDGQPAVSILELQKGKG